MEKITKEEFVKKAVDLLARNEVYELGAKEKNRLIFLFLFVKDMAFGTYTEKEINEKIKAVLEKLPQVHIDHVKIRRALIDYGFLERTKNGAVYIFAEENPALKMFSKDVFEVNIFQEIEDFLKKVEARKREHTS